MQLHSHACLHVVGAFQQHAKTYMSALGQRMVKTNYPLLMTSTTWWNLFSSSCKGLQPFIKSCDTSKNRKNMYPKCHCQFNQDVNKQGVERLPTSPLLCSSIYISCNTFVTHLITSQTSS